MRTTRFFLLTALAIWVSAGLSAETLAVAVRLDGEPDEENRVAALLLMLEEGAMDAMFGDGHIVFDIDSGDEYELPRLRAINEARTGGAEYLVLIDAEFGIEAGIGIIPFATVVTIVDVRSEADQSVESVDPRSLPGAKDKTPEALCREVGELVALSVLTAIREATW